MITVNSMNYTSLESGNLQNIEFFNITGNAIPSWLESNNTNTSTGTIYWVKLTNSILGRSSATTGIQGHTNVTIFMGFAPLTTNLFSNTITGEAPQLSSTYAQYDNGANVFTTFYDNFEGSTINTMTYNVILPSGASITQNNGITIATTSVTGAGFVTNNGFAPPIVFETDVIGGTGGNDGVGIALFSGNTSSSQGYRFSTSCSVAYMAYGFGGTISCTGNPAVNLGPGVMGGVWYGPSSQTWYKNYTQYGGTQGYGLPAKEYLVYGESYSLGSISLQWSRVRSYLPNGVMPSVTFGSSSTIVIPTITPSGSQVVYGNANQILSFTSTMKGTTPPYTYNWIATNTVTGAVVANALYKSVSSNSNTFAFKANAQMDGNTIRVNVIVTDSQSNIINSIKTETITISSVTVPSGVITYVPITIGNAQASATTSPSQQMIVVNSSNYTVLEAGNLQNIEFFNITGAIIPSWHETHENYCIRLCLDSSKVTAPSKY